jgi:hypothetical protein
MPLPLQAPQPLPAVISYFTDVLCNSSRRLLVRPLRQSSLTRTFDLEILLRQVDYDKKKICYEEHQRGYLATSADWEWRFLTLSVKSRERKSMARKNGLGCRIRT